MQIDSLSRRPTDRENMSVSDWQRVVQYDVYAVLILAKVSFSRIGIFGQKSLGLRTIVKRSIYDHIRRAAQRNAKATHAHSINQL